MGYICVPLYETLGENAIEYIIDHSETKVVVVAAKRLARFAASLPLMKQKLLAVVVWDDAATADVEVGQQTVTWEHT